jgi:hypothetical protein
VILSNLAIFKYLQAQFLWWLRCFARAGEMKLFASIALSTQKVESILRTPWAAKPARKKSAKRVVWSICFIGKIHLTTFDQMNLVLSLFDKV